jgi:hypothetical protein
MTESRPKVGRSSLADLTGVTRVIRGLLALEPKRRKSRLPWVFVLGIFVFVGGMFTDVSAREFAMAKAGFAKASPAAASPDAANAPGFGAPSSVPLAAPAAETPNGVVSWPAVVRAVPAPAVTVKVTASAPATPATAVRAGDAGQKAQLRAPARSRSRNGG